jgi:hypothetical protein
LKIYIKSPICFIFLRLFKIEKIFEQLWKNNIIRCFCTKTVFCLFQPKASFLKLFKNKICSNMFMFSFEKITKNEHTFNITSFSQRQPFACSTNLENE